MNDLMTMKHYLLSTQLQMMMWVVQATVYCPDLTPAEAVQSSVRKKLLGF